MAGTAEGAARARAKLKQRQLEQQAAREAVIAASLPRRTSGKVSIRRLNKGDGSSTIPTPGVHLVEPGEQQPEQSVMPPSEHQPSAEPPDAIPDHQTSETHQSLMHVPENVGGNPAIFQQQNPQLVPNLLNAAAPEMALVLIGLARARKTPAGVRMEAASRVLGLAGYVAPSSKDAKGSSAPDAMESVKLLPAVVRVLELRRTAEGATDAELVPNQSRASTA